MSSQGGGYKDNFNMDDSILSDDCDVENLDSRSKCVNNSSDISHLTVEPFKKKRKPKGKSQRSGGCIPPENELQVSTWLNISMDPINGNDQKSKKYRNRVHEYFYKHKTFTSSRTSSSLSNRWSTIQQAVNKFCGSYAQVIGSNQSGINKQDKIHMAKLLYFEDHFATFNLENCWNKLRLAPKWIEEGEKKKIKKPAKANGSSIKSTVNLDEDNAQDESTINVVKPSRPPGNKGEKERMKNLKEKELVVDPLVALIDEIRKEKRKTSTQQTELLEKMVMMQQKQEDDRIMSMDLTNLTPIQAEYYMRRQADILLRMR